MTIILLTSGMVLLLTCATFVTYEIVTLPSSMVRGLMTRAQIIAANSTAALAFENEADATDVLHALKSDPRMLAACIYDKNGKVFARYPTNALAADFPPAPSRSGHRFESAHLVVFCPVTQDDKILGTVYIKSDLSVLTDRYNAYAFLAAIVIVASTIAAYLVSRVLQKQISLPILALAETAKAISDRRDFSVRARKQGEDELGLLTDALNQMLTQIERQNQALREGEERVRAIINSALSAVVVIDSDGRITDWNDRAEEMFGWPRNEAIGRELAETIIPPRYREAHRRGIIHFKLSGEGPVLNRTVEMAALRRNGTEFPVELSISPLKAGDTMSFCGFITDISERKRSEQQVLLQATALDTAANAIMITNRAGVILWVNQAFSSLTGYRPEEVIHQNPRILKSGHHDDAYYSKLWDTILAGRTWQGEFTNRRKDGSLYHDEHTIAPVRSRDGEITHFVAIMQDITERKRAEAEIQELNTTLERRVGERTAQLEAVNRELEAFSYSVSHDLRAPLRHINGFADMLQQEPMANLGESGRRYLGIISEAAKRMGVLIDDLLVFSRMGRSEMRWTVVDMNELVAEALNEMANDLADRDIQWNMGTLPKVTVDRPMLKQVWVNLLSNAVKYTRQRDQARITIRCHKNRGVEWEFSVQDNGAGFDMQYAGKLFGVFQRLHQVEEFEGTGIGLANVRRIVSRHGGRTWAEGRVDEGATFHFTLPDHKKGAEDERVQTHTPC
jgi:PAS domain S-box-containing protein